MSKPTNAQVHAPRILLVDDDESCGRAVSRLLASCGLRTARAANWQKAVDWLRQMPPPMLILLDLHMPVMDGWTFLRHRVQDPALRRIPVVVLSGELGEVPVPVPVLSKPLGLERLAPFLRRYCGITIGGLSYGYGRGRPPYPLKLDVTLAGGA